MPACPDPPPLPEALPLPLATDRPGALAPAMALCRGPVQACAPDAPVQAAAGQMARAGVSSLLVVDGERLVGIVTDRDLRNRILARNRAADTPVRAVMTPDPRTLPASATALEALLTLSAHGIHHLPLVDGDAVRGLVTDTDLLHWLAVQPLPLVAAVQTAPDRAALIAASAALPDLQARLLAEGLDGSRIAALLAGAIDALTGRLLALAQRELGPAPVDWVWVATGSLGRGEVTPYSDQDNALILSDDYRAESHEAYFARLAAWVTEGLAACGIRRCPGEVMASTPDYRRPLAAWCAQFDHWLRRAGRKDAMLVANFVDMRSVAGNARLTAALLTHVRAAAAGREVLHARLVSNLLDNRPPLGFFGQISTTGRGEAAGTVELKTALIIPIVDMARVAALALGVDATRTLDRLAAVGGSDWLSRPAAADLDDALRFALTLRAQVQVARAQAGLPPDNRLAPASLPPMQHARLRQALQVVDQVQRVLAQRFPELAD